MTRTGTQPRGEQLEAPLLLAAPDKFRGTAGAAELAAAAAAAATESGWRAIALPLADGGEGLLEVAGGERRETVVTGPLGEPVRAEWALRAGDGLPTALIEMARASGIALAGGPERNDPVRATTAGTGELVLAALEAGARRIVVGCGGSATTDGGAGALAALGDRPLPAGVELVVACDVSTTFVEAAQVFAPQKGASPAQVRQLSERLEELAARYRERYGVDVSALPGAGAAGGLAGGLVAIGGRLRPGFDLVAELTGLDDALRHADLVLTGEGRLDRTSLEGKVVTSLLRRIGGSLPALVVVGEATGVDAAALAAAAGVPAAGVEVVSLSERYGAAESLARPAQRLADVVRERLRSAGPGPASAASARQGRGVRKGRRAGTGSSPDPTAARSS